MKPSIAALFNNLTPSTLALLEECSEELLYAPGYIQPHGVLLLLEEPTLRILQISENGEPFFGLASEALLGQTLPQFLSPKDAKRVAQFLQSSAIEVHNPLELIIQRTGTQSSSKKSAVQAFNGVFHRTEAGLLLELEPKVAEAISSPLQAYQRLQTVIAALRCADSLTELVQILAREVKSLTGFDRVMIYRFEADDHGVVIAEDKESHLESFLELHYPATDIPVASRKLFYRNWVRQIPDVNAPPARLVTAPESPPLDLSLCVLRGVSPHHIEYLQNMGVAGTLTVSLIDDQRLWGLIACHHSSPRFLDYTTRKTCEFLGQFASVELVHQQERELQRYRTQVKEIQDCLQQDFLKDFNCIEQVLVHNPDQLLELVHAQGAVIVLDGKLTQIGITPSEVEIQDLVAWLLQQQAESQTPHSSHRERIFATSTLPQVYPPAQSFKDRGSGLLAISILLKQGREKSYHILWFRPEQVQLVNWAGNPQNAITIDADGIPRLCPRKSFELWKETVQEMSVPWQAVELEAATEMRNALMLAVLEFSQVALEQAAERAAIANRAKSQFLAKMSHELRTPLNAILGFTQIMNYSPDIPSEFQEYLGIISRSGEHLLSLINDVLEMSKIEAGQLSLRESAFDLSRFLRSIHEMLGLKALQKGILLKVEQDDSVPRYVYGDEAKLRQILINLLTNAVKFTTEGQITLRVTVKGPVKEIQRETGCNPETAGTPMLLCFEVADTGCGIPTSELESIFEAFMQTKQGHRGQGTGLGLSISRQFARLMGGDITVQSILHKSSTFTCKVILSMLECADWIEADTHSQITGLEPNQPTYRILIAEDVSENRRLLITLLESVGFEVQAVDNGREAINRWQTWQPHLIFMDIQMPVLDGYQATQQIRLEEASRRKQRSELEDCPPITTKIIALTAYAFEDDRLASLDAGCDDYIAKPFTEADLLDKIARHLGVRYSYIEKTLSKSIAAPKQLTPQDLQTMPDAWISQVHNAALDLNDRKLLQLIAQIPPEQQPLSEALSLLVNNFQLELIALLTER